MGSYPNRNRQEWALRCVLLTVAARRAALLSSRGYQMLDGEWVSYEAGQAALRDGTAVLVSGLLVGRIAAGFPQ